MDKGKRDKLIAQAAIESHISGDCKSLYYDDVLIENGMTFLEMERFLAENSKLIDDVESQIVRAVTNYVKEVYIL